MTAKRNGFVLFGLIAVAVGVVFALPDHKSLIKSEVVQHIELTSENSAGLVTDVNSESVFYTIKKLNELDKTKTRYLYIESPGGEVISGLDLVEYLRSDDGKGIVCVANKAASMAFVTLQSCETRLVVETTLLMSHGISGGTGGDVHTIKKQLEFMEKLETMLLELIANRIGISVETLRSRQNPEWWIVGAKEAIKEGAADGIASVTFNLSKTTNETKDK